MITHDLLIAGGSPVRMQVALKAGKNVDVVVISEVNTLTYPFKSSTGRNRCSTGRPGIRDPILPGIDRYTHLPSGSIIITS